MQQHMHLSLSTLQFLLLVGTLFQPGTLLLIHQQIDSGPRILCQICGKLNHLAFDCFHRMETTFIGWTLHSKEDVLLLNCMPWWLTPKLPMMIKNGMQIGLLMHTSLMI